MKEEVGFSYSAPRETEQQQKERRIRDLKAEASQIARRLVAIHEELAVLGG